MDLNEVLCTYGTPLEPLDEDEIPSKKPIAIEDQIVTDVNGRRRFHGAFTGGFSAGFWNTVGSLEGWKPQTFKSSRSEKADCKEQAPIDFMDDEDLGEFGIAPQRVQTTDDFKIQDIKQVSNKNKRHFEKHFGPIPGLPVLEQLLKPPKDNVATRILKKMGWKAGQGIGARQTRKEKNKSAIQNEREKYIMENYGCNVNFSSKNESNDDLEYEGLDDELTFAPDDIEPFVCCIKDNTFGLGYTGLSREPVLSKHHVNLFDEFQVAGKGNKALSIRGQAFGVGALEEEDEDIYNTDDMTKYDFSLVGAQKLKKKQLVHHSNDDNIIEGFEKSIKQHKCHKKIFTVVIPIDYKPRNWLLRKSRFEPLNEIKAAILQKDEEHKIKGLGRHDLDPETRGTILDSTIQTKEDEKNKLANKNTTKAAKYKLNYLERINEKYKDKEIKNSLEHNKKVQDIIYGADKFTHGEIINANKNNKLTEAHENEKILTEAKKITKSLDSNTGLFKPFVNNPEKQERYEKFIKANLKTNEEIDQFLKSLHPLNMSEWDLQVEKREFLQAKNIFKPLKGMMSDRFISEAAIDLKKENETSSSQETKKFNIERMTSVWKPHHQLCKQFNIAEPFGGLMPTEKLQKKSRFSVFDYNEAPLYTKNNFIPPIPFPPKMLEPKSIVSEENIKLKEISPTKDIIKITKQSITQKIITNNKTNIMPNIRKPRTEIERKIEENKSNHPSEKKDLFKSIFESSSEDEIENDSNINAKNSNVKTDNLKTEQISLNSNSPSTDILEITTPAKGLFANLFTRKSKRESNEKGKTSELTETTLPNEISKGQVIHDKDKKKTILCFTSKKELDSEQNMDINVTENHTNIFGPKIPTNKNLVSSDCNEISFIREYRNSNSSTTEEWVEKSNLDDKQRKTKKKVKKKKSKKHKKGKKK